eukprot:534909-Pyramimonas_sp.AAC.1
MSADGADAGGGGGARVNAEARAQPGAAGTAAHAGAARSAVDPQPNEGPRRARRVHHSHADVLPAAGGRCPRAPDGGQRRRGAGPTNQRSPHKTPLLEAWKECVIYLMCGLFLGFTSRACEFTASRVNRRSAGGGGSAEPAARFAHADRRCHAEGK